MKLNEQQLPTKLKNFLDKSQIHSVKQLRDRMLRDGHCRRFRDCGPVMENLINQIDGINAEEIKAQYEGRQKIKEALFEFEFPNSADFIKKYCRWGWKDWTKDDLVEFLFRNIYRLFYRAGLNQGSQCKLTRMRLSPKTIAGLILDSGIDPEDFFNAVLEYKEQYKRQALKTFIEYRLNEIKKHLTLA